MAYDLLIMSTDRRQHDADEQTDNHREEHAGQGPELTPRGQHIDEEDKCPHPEAGDDHANEIGLPIRRLSGDLYGHCRWRA